MENIRVNVEFARKRGSGNVLLTIDRVYPKPREFNTARGSAVTVKVLFTDGSEGDLWVRKGETPQDHIEKLTALVGKESEFEIDASKEREYNGVIQRALTGYPGKPVGGGFGGGGGRNFTPAWANTEAGERYVQERMDRRTALMQAVALFADVPNPNLENVLIWSTEFYAFLRTSDSVPTPTPANTPSMPQNATQRQETATPHVSVGGVWEGEGNCPGCNAPPQKPHGSKCTGKGQEE